MRIGIRRQFRPRPGIVVEMSNPEPNFSLSSSIFSKLQSEIPPLAPEQTQQDGIFMSYFIFLILLEEDGRLKEIYSKYRSCFLLGLIFLELVCCFRDISLGSSPKPSKLFLLCKIGKRFYL
jgi:hypothetical protein